MATQSKTRKVIVSPNGSRRVLRRDHGHYMVTDSVGFSHMDMVRDWCGENGCDLVTEPNPFYREPSPFGVLGKLLG